MADLVGTPGQGQSNPLSLFFNHVLIAYGDAIYDPSYGKYYSSMETFETNAIAAFVIERTLIEMKVGADLNGDGKIDETKVLVFLFRRNLPGQDLI